MDDAMKKMMERAEEVVETFKKTPRLVETADEQYERHRRLFKPGCRFLTLGGWSTLISVDLEKCVIFFEYDEGGVGMYDPPFKGDEETPFDLVDDYLECVYDVRLPRGGN